MEPVCRVLNERAAAWLRRRCGVGAAARMRATVRYHQARNTAAHRSRLRYRKRKIKELLAL